MAGRSVRRIRDRIRDRALSQGVSGPVEPHPIREAWLFLSLALAFSSGIAQLTTTGAWQLVLVLIFGISFLYLVLRLAQLYFSQSSRRLRLDIGQYREVLADIAIRYQQKFAEDVEIIFVIGDKHEYDRVIEKRRTRPEAALLHRDIYLSRNLHTDVPSLHTMTPQLKRESDSPVQLSWLPLDDTETIHGMVVFRPSLVEECVWSIEYRSPDLWAPLRSTGLDHLSYRFRDGKMTPGGRMIVRVSFPPGAAAVMLRPEGDWAVISEEVDASSGRRIVSSTTTSQDRLYYAWDIAMEKK